MGAVDAHHDHGRQRRQLDRHPHQADIVGDQREVHAEHHHLIHGVIKTQVIRRQAAGFQLMADITGAEHAGGEADKGVEHDEDDVEIVNEKVSAVAAYASEQGKRGQQRQKAC